MTTHLLGCKGLTTEKSMALMKTVILKKTISVVAKEGIDNFSTRTIAKECGCSEGLIFHHFSTKKNLLDMCYRHICDNFNETIRNETEGETVFRAIWHAFCKYMKTNFEEAKFCIGYLRLNDGLTEGLGIIKDSLRKIFPGRDEGFIDSMTREAAAIGCLYGVGVIRWEEEMDEDYKRFGLEILGIDS